MIIYLNDQSPSAEFYAVDGNGDPKNTLSGVAATWQRFKGGRPIGDPTSFSVSALEESSDVWESGGYVLLGDGIWRIDLPRAAVETGTDHADRLIITVSATGATIVSPSIDLHTEFGLWTQEDIDALNAAIVTRQVQVVGPPVPPEASNTMTIYRGDDYLEIDGTEISFTGAPPPCDDLDLENVTVYLIAKSADSSENVLQVAALDVSENEDDTVTVKFELDHDDSAALPAGSYRYFERWKWTDGTIKTRQKGTLIVEDAWEIETA